MVLMPVSLLQSDMIIAKDVPTNSSINSRIPLLRKGICLNDLIILKLKSYDIDTVYVEMEGTFDIVAPDIIDSELKDEALCQIENIFHSLENSSKIVTPAVFEDVNELSKKLVENAMNDPDVLISLVNLKRHDDYTYIHSLCVSVLSIATGLSLGYEYKDLKNLSAAALLHDIGKMAIPAELINKPDVLTEEEFDLIKTHPDKGVEIVTKRNSFVPFTILSGIRSHHERYDGTGYPNGLKTDDIHPYAKIIAIGDVYDALTSDRPYRKASKPYEAIEYIMGCGNTHFDINMVKHFLKKVVAYPVGSMVSLSDGRRAVVVENHPENIMRPKIRILSKRAAKQIELDLLNDLDCYNIVITGM